MTGVQTCALPICKGEFFKTVELGWTTSRDRIFLDNKHLTLWHVDERKAAGVPAGWGASFSYATSINDQFLPFFRAGYAKDGGSFLQKSVSAGLGTSSEAMTACWVLVSIGGIPMQPPMARA